MLKYFLKNTAKLAWILLCGASMLVYSSCKEAAPAPYTTTVESADQTPAAPDSTLTASVNGSPTIRFAPSKTVGGGYTSLIGTTANYTVTVTFPSSTGVGDFFLSSTGFSASLFDGTNTYLVNATYGTGSIDINSITSGRYSGTFSFIAETTSHTSISVSAGTFSNL